MKIEILLPNRIGDAILTIPALFCLKQLEQTYHNGKNQMVIYPPSSLLPIFSALQITKTQPFTVKTKLASWIQPADETFFLYSSNKYLGLRTQKAYGLYNPKKLFSKSLKDMPYLGIPHGDPALPPELLNFLRTHHGLSAAAMRYFGLCIERQFSIEQILETFSFSPDSVNIPPPSTKSQINLPQTPYIVCCMEAAYGSQRDTQRRWPEALFFETAEKLYQTYELATVFIGVQQTPLIPKQPYFYDIRGQYTLTETAILLQNATGFIGNDSGPLHLANLLKVSSVGLYLSTTPQHYGPIFPQLNRPVLHAKTVEAAWPAIEQLISSLKNPCSLNH